jgi:hypothetical protein
MESQSRVRIQAATTSLAACALGLATYAVASEPLSNGAAAIAVGLAAFGLGRRSIVAQVLARGTAWAVCLMTLIASVDAAFRGSFDPAFVALAAGSGLSLVLARPMLHTESARAAFAPVVHRRWLLAASVASVAGASFAAFVGTFLATSWIGDAADAAVWFALSTALVAAGVGVIRMRGWGLLLGMTTSAVVIAWALALGGGAIVGACAVPGLMFALPVLLRRPARPIAARPEMGHHEVAAPAFAVGGTRVADERPPEPEELEETWSGLRAAGVVR